MLTSNLGAAEARPLRSEQTRRLRARRARPSATHARIAEAMIAAARAGAAARALQPHRRGALLRPLARADVAEIARRLLGGLGDALELRGVALDIEPGVVDALLDAGGFDPELGARPMKRAIARLVEAPLAEMILRGELEDGAVALVSVEKGEIVVDAVRRQRVGA